MTDYYATLGVPRTASAGEIKNITTMQNENYLSQISNTNLKRLLLREENIVVLEDLLDTEAQRLERLQKRHENDKLNLGERVSPDELTEVFPRICTEVDDFLGIQESDMPTFGYFNLLKDGKSILALYILSPLQVACAVTSMITEQNPEYNPLFFAGMGAMQFVMAVNLHSDNNRSSYLSTSTTITLERTPRTVLIPSAAHEYTHHLQHRKGLKEGKYSIFKEGHARGIERYISKLYREREDNEAFLYDFLNETTSEMKNAYLWMCRNLRKPVKECLLRTKTSRDFDEGAWRFVFRQPTHHAIGNTLFSIYQAQQGNHIYRDMIHGRFRFE